MPPKSKAAKSKSAKATDVDAKKQKEEEEAERYAGESERMCFQMIRDGTILDQLTDETSRISEFKNYVVITRPTTLKV